MSDTRRGTVESAPKGLSLQAQPMSAPKGPVGKTQAKPATEQSERRGAVILIQRGDPQITGAIAEGMLEGRDRRTTSSVWPSASHLPLKGKALEPEQMEIVVSVLKELRAQAPALEGPDAPDTRGQGSAASCAGRGAYAEIDRQHIARLVRVAVGNDNTPEDYQCMIVKARHDYGKYYRRPGPLRRFADALLGVYALIVCGVSAAYQSQERVLGRRD